MKLLTVELMSDAKGNLNIPYISLKGLESEAPFTFKVCMREEEKEETLCIPQGLLEEAGIDPIEGMQIMTGAGIVAICQSDQCEVIRLIAGGMPNVRV